MKQTAFLLLITVIFVSCGALEYPDEAKAWLSKFRGSIAEAEGLVNTSKALKEKKQALNPSDPKAVEAFNLEMDAMKARIDAFRDQIVQLSSEKKDLLDKIPPNLQDKFIEEAQEISKFISAQGAKLAMD